MVEPSCFAQDSDHALHKSNANSQASVASALGGSVSFGRFLSESLDWGKWSSFCQKRYLEEAAKYSTPGSVAQKKAFFEARYTKKKHTAVAQPEPEAEECRDEPSEIFDENRNDGHSMELTKPLSDKKPLEEICVNEQNVGGSTEKKVSPTLKSSARRSTRPSPPPFLKENGRNESTTPISGKNKRGSIERKKSSTPTSVHASVNFTRSRTGSTTPLTNKCSPVMKKARETKVFTGSITPSTNKPSPAMKKAKETKASSNCVSKFASLTPHSEQGRVRSPLNQIPSAGKQVDVKMHSIGYSNRSCIKGDRAQSEVASSSNILETNQRVEKRKKARFYL
ncbi:protein WVD2-like 7 isoform X1 [Iris pallida]|uniref:Protein WVD2-like 7 isoform X1 n=1 Tax=Iris pallida TaxID=29817 RepID=A0AAX6DMS0_IRIPA|nr:protein WVD2-like 7 isoform X1 [Iris pallida]